MQNSNRRTYWKSCAVQAWNVSIGCACALGMLGTTICVCMFVCSFRLKPECRVKTALFDCEWDVDDDSRLLRGVYEYGLGNWDALKMDHNLQLHNKVVVTADTDDRHVFVQVSLLHETN